VGKNGFFEKSALAIGMKMNLDSNDKNLVALMINCNCLETSVVGGGPTENGANAARWDDTIQRSFYNGWKSIHGLKHQTVDNAYGLTVDMCGPTTLRRNDLALLRDSDINARMYIAQINEEDQYIIFGDWAYNEQAHITSYNKGSDPDNEWRKWNNALEKVRVSIEWNYGYTATLFNYIGKARKLQVLKSDTVHEIYTVVTILRNCHAALYECQTSNYFDIRLPDNFLECYLTKTNM
jgi:hypothetical protein